MASEEKRIQKTVSIVEDEGHKKRFLQNYQSIRLHGESIDVLMDPSSSSVVTYVKPGTIERKVYRYKDRAGDFWKEIHKVVVNKKQQVIFVEKRYRNHQYVTSFRRRWNDGNAADWIMKQMRDSEEEG
ncbi:hypothetical protein [Hydrogenimonas urashimensis]|uniref:hypothetical protein n=1 Tax=Hydrogenimonas urashimensis TaxID=2740515 RepID=UPI001916A1B8|nr:hypothetical protein [Hydrogenimonas urashimensis]